MIENASGAHQLVHQFNIFDIFLLVVLAISALIGFVRGFVRESLGLAAWGGAALLALKDFAWPRTLFSSWISDEGLQHIAGQVLVFFVSLVCFLIIAQILAQYVQNSLAQGIDRSLGVTFGLVRGAGFLSIFYMGMLFFVPISKHPAVVTTSWGMPYLQDGAVFIKKFLPAGWKPRMILDDRLQGLAGDAPASSVAQQKAPQGVSQGIAKKDSPKEHKD